MCKKETTGKKKTLCMHSKRFWHKHKVLYDNTAYITFCIIRLQENTFIVNFKFQPSVDVHALELRNCLKTCL